MSVSRRKFTREFKETAIRRLEQLELGASIAEVARACEVNPNILHRWRGVRELGARFAGPGRSRYRRKTAHAHPVGKTLPVGRRQPGGLLSLALSLAGGGIFRRQDYAVTNRRRRARSPP
jgi:transposase-like protein